MTKTEWKLKNKKGGRLEGDGIKNIFLSFSRLLKQTPEKTTSKQNLYLNYIALDEYQMYLLTGSAPNTLDLLVCEKTVMAEPPPQFEF